MSPRSIGLLTAQSAYLFEWPDTVLLVLVVVMQLVSANSICNSDGLLGFLLHM